MEETRAFNEWLLSCEQADSVLTNEPFFKLLSLFSGRPASNAISDGNVSNDVAVGGKVQNYGCTGRNDFDGSFCTGHGTEERRAGAADDGESSQVVEDGAPRRDSQAVGVRDEIEGGRNVHAKHVTVQDADVFAQNDSDDLFDGQQFDERADFGNALTTAVQRGTSPAICGGGGGYTTGDSVEPDRGDRTTNESRRTEGGRDEQNRRDDVAIDDRVAGVDAGSSGSVRLVECDDDGDVAPSGNSDFGDMFKSQRADKFIERYCNSAEITAAPSAIECAGVDDDVGSSISDSPEFFSCKIPNKKRVQTKPTDCMARATPAETVDLLTPESADDPPPGPVKDDSFLSDNDADLMFLDYCSDGSNGVFTQRERPVRDTSGGAAGGVYTQKEPVVDEIGAGAAGDAYAWPARTDGEDGSRSKTRIGETDAEKAAPDAPVAYNNNRGGGGGLLPFNILKAVNLLKPGFSLKRNTTATTAKRQQQRIEEVRAGPADDGVSPLRPSWPRGGPRKNFSQSTPKDDRAKRPLATASVAAAPATRRTAGLQSLLTSSSDSDVIVDDRDDDDDDKNKMAKRSRRVKNRRRQKRRKKVRLESNCFVFFGHYRITSGVNRGGGLSSSFISSQAPQN